jgi:hypothetical protein
LEGDEMAYIVKLNNAFHHGVRVDGEYLGGDSLKAAMEEAAFFRRECPGARIRVCLPTNDGESLETVEEIS